MEINRVDVAHEEIIEQCQEYFLVSAEFQGDDKYITRAFANTDGELLKEILLEEMFNSEIFATFVLEVANDYKQLNSKK